MADANVHNGRWLEYSPGSPIEGTELRNRCYNMNLEQKVTRPTRGKYLLDLVLTDVPSIRTSGVGIADHIVVLASIELLAPKGPVGERVVLDHAKADWDRLSEELFDKDWTFIDRSSPTEGVDKLNNTLLEAVSRSIPERTVSAKQCSHPWLDDVAMRVVAAKQAAVGTDDEDKMTRMCSEVLARGYSNFITKTAG
jgi:hypothetical protein